MSTTVLPFKVRAKYGWSGQTKEDLGFLEGDIMEVTRITGDWYYGKLLRNKKCTGYFPNNFVVVLEEKTLPNEDKTNSKKLNSIEQSEKQKQTTEESSSSSSSPPSSLSSASSLPPIPSRDANLKSSKRTRTPKSYYYSKHNVSSDLSQGNYYKNRSIHDNFTKNVYSNGFYELNHSSSPELHSISKENPHTTNEHSKINQLKPQRKHHNNPFWEQSKNSPLPPLPPLPSGIKISSSSPSLISPVSSTNDTSTKLNRTNIYKNSPKHLVDSQQLYYRLHKRTSYDSAMKSDSINSKLYSSDSSNGNASTGIFSNSKYLDTSLTDSENSFALMSDFSATSAGSFARHKHAQSFTDSLERSRSSRYFPNGPVFDSQHISENGNSDLKNSNNGKMGDLLRRLIPNSSSSSSSSNILSSPLISASNKNLPKLPSIQNLNISDKNEAKDWITVKSQVNRSRTLTKYEKHPRYMRALEEHRDLVLHPQDSIYNGLNTNEIKSGGKPGMVNVLLTELNCEYIDEMTRKRCNKVGNFSLSSWARMNFSARYKTTLDILRGIYIFCAEKFELIDDNSTTDFTCEPPNLDQILYSQYCTPYQLTWLFKKLANTLGITCEIVIGFLKTPDSNDYEFKFNHCWLRVLVHREWRFVDIILGNTTNPIHEFVNNEPAKKADDSYFLVEPLDFIYTHIPPREFEQHIVPSIDQLSTIYLPLVFPSFFQNNIKLYNYSTALSYLEDTEIFECSIEIPNDIEVFTSVVVSDVDEHKQHEYGQMELSLSQIKKHKSNSGRRIAILKAVLPPNVQKGMLYIHSGVRGKQKTRANIHPLTMMIPLEHRGIDMKYEFVVKLPSENVQSVEMYIKEPQNRYLFPNNEYVFEIIQMPFDGVIYDSVSQNKEQPMAIKSPSGEIYKLHKRDPQSLFGTWETKVKIKEPGIWTAIVVSDSGLGWCTFAEWLCVSGSTTDCFLTSR